MHPPSFGSSDKLQQLARTELGIPVIWGNPNAPRPPKPYAAITITSDIQQANSSRSPLDEDFKSLIITHDMVTTSISVFSSIEANPMDGIERMRSLRQALVMPSVLLGLSEGGWSFIRVLMGPNNIPNLVDTRWEPRAIMDVEWRVVRSVLDDLGVVEQVNISGEISNIPIDDNIIVPVSRIFGFDEGGFES